MFSVYVYTIYSIIYIYIYRKVYNYLHDANYKSY